MKGFVAVALLALAACSSKGTSDRSDWEKKNEGRLNSEQGAVAPELPPYPGKDGLLPFFVSSASDFRFFIDRASLTVSKERLIRYTLVARSSTGTDNVSFEGMNCLTAEYIVYAVGVQGNWVARPTQWRAIEPRSVQRWHNTLRLEYFCPNNVPIEDAAEGLNALRRGGHPHVQSSPAVR